MLHSFHHPHARHTRFPVRLPLFPLSDNVPVRRARVLGFIVRDQPDVSVIMIESTNSEDKRVL
jgi:hypothetical protein